MTGNRVSLATALVLVLAEIAVVARAGLFVTTFPGHELKPLCEDKPTNLTLRSHLDALLEQADDLVASGDCTQYIHLALKEFKELLGSVSDAVCTMDKAEKIKAYYLKYLDTSSGRRARETLPKSLRHFVLGYGMKVSYFCKRKMALDFKGLAADEMIGEYRMDPSDLLREESVLSKLLNAEHKLDDILLPRHLGRMMPRGADLRDELSVRGIHDALHKKAVCELRYRPIYEQNILPVTVLASIGLEYSSKKIFHDLITDSLKYWSQMAFVCELISTINMKGEARVSSHSYPNVQPLRESFRSNFAVGEEVYDKQNKHLVAAVKSFRTDLSEADRDMELVIKFGGLRLIRNYHEDILIGHLMQ